MSERKARAAVGRNDDDDEAAAGRLGQRIKDHRAARGWSLDLLAQTSGVSRSMLSQIERGQANPTVGVAFRIARAFAMSVGELLETPDATPNITVVRADDRAYHYRSDRHCRIRTLSPLDLEKDVELYEVQLTPGGTLRSAAHYEGTREFLTVQRGRVRVESGADSADLGEGDSATYRADIAHAIVNVGKGEALVLLVDIYR